MRSSKKVNAGSRRVMSPRNLLITSPLTSLLSSSSKSSKVPTIDANAPPRSISAIRNTGDWHSFAILIFTMSFFFKLTSAGLPAPSITRIS